MKPTNRLIRVNKGDVWLTPPALLKALGSFDTDACCPPVMPWKTAKRMICEPQDGLTVRWIGRVWCNPPFSNILPFLARMIEHGNGVMLIPGKSPETKWGQTALLHADAVYFLAGRLLFHTETGAPTSGKWSPHNLLAFGQHNIKALEQLGHRDYPGVLMVRK